ncbi:MAG: DNA mismatch repair endonuclease MutL [candidate division Zixibacteria bacterium]|nr:DNA mismatch repair endonuclease MutL [candidate division Zixibacteria bacterium]
MVGFIAAGEVVEGPWSVVKELMENSLDAGARRVDVSVEGGGFKEIKVVDDGCGMDADDLALAFERYATSKVARPEDLAAVATLGFRGEALPAIAAVSRVTAYTRAEGEPTGFKAVAAGGDVVVTREGAPLGTTMAVRELFYNVPARRKFAGKPTSEWRRAAEVFKRLALAQLGPTFSLTKDRRLQYTASPNAAARQRIGEILGWELTEQLIPVATERDRFSLEAYLSLASLSYGTTGNIYTVVNGRPARAKPVFKAVMSAYEGRLERARYPLVVLYFNLPEEDVDVNVHPRKEEVRFTDENGVFEFVSTALREALTGAGVALTPASFEVRAKTRPVHAGEEVTADVRETVQRYLRTHGLWPEAAAGRPAPGRPAEMLRPPSPTFPPAGRARGDEGVEVLGQLDNTYIIVRRGRDLVVIDQHTAHERVLYERLSRAGVAEGCQRLLIPVTVTLAPAAAADLRACLQTLNDLGFEIADFGGGAFAARGHPNDVRVNDIKMFLGQVVEDFVDEGRPAAAVERRETVLKGVACHGAVKAGERLEPAEMAALVEDLLATAMPDVCPHGRPTMVNLAAKELERLFRR